MEFTKKEGYALQIGYLIKGSSFPEACRLSEEFVLRFPGEPLSHFMAAKSYFLAGDYAKANVEGRKAFNLSSAKEDMLSSAVVTASALLMMGRFREGLELLSPYKEERNGEVKKLLIMLSASSGDGRAAGERFKELYALNYEGAAEFIRKLARGRKAEG